MTGIFLIIAVVGGAFWTVHGLDKVRRNQQRQIELLEQLVAQTKRPHAG